MTTPRERVTAININRFLIWLLVVISAVLNNPFTVSDVVSIVAATIWLWLPQLIRLELKLLDKWRR
jgi:hypothetical protein